MRIQKQISLLTEETKPLLHSIPHGETCSFRGKILMRLKPTSFLLNSTLVGDVLNRGDCFVCNVETGTLYIMPGNIEVESVDATLLIKEL